MILLRQKYFSEAGRKKLEERARKKANKTKWQLEKATDTNWHDWGSRLLGESEKIKMSEDGKNWLKSHDKQRALGLLKIGAKPDEIIQKNPYIRADERVLDGQSIPIKVYKQPDSVKKEIDIVEETLRAGRRASRHKPSLLDLEIGPEKYQETLNRSINMGKAGILGENKMAPFLKYNLREKKKELEQEKERAAREAEKRLQKIKSKKRAAALIIGGTLATGAAIGTAKAIKKKKSKKK